MGDPPSCTPGRTEPQPKLRTALDANSRCRPMRRLRRVVADVGREPGFGAMPPCGEVVPHDGQTRPANRIAPRLGRLGTPGDSPVVRAASGENRHGSRGRLVDQAPI